jgi:hypothetical protein
MEIRQPSQATLDKYGLTLELWLAIWDHQDRMCPVCEKEPKTGTGVEFNIDHRHVPNYYKKTAEERRKYVRGIVCNHCNRV